MAKGAVKSGLPDTATEQLREEEALQASVRNTAEQNALLEARLAKVRSQNEALSTLLQEQETYLEEVEAQIGRMQERRRNWRQRFTELTGASLDDTVGVRP